MVTKYYYIFCKAEIKPLIFLSTYYYLYYYHQALINYYQVLDYLKIK